MLRKLKRKLKRKAKKEIKHFAIRNVIHIFGGSAIAAAAIYLIK